MLALANVDVFFHKFDEAVSRARHALRLAPNSPDAHGWLGAFLTLAGECEEAMEELKTAIRLGPRSSSNAIWYGYMVLALFQEHRYEECIQWCEDSLKDLPNALPAMHRPMAASYAMLDRMDEARAAIAQLKSRAPSVSAETTQSFPFAANRWVRQEIDTGAKDMAREGRLYNFGASLHPRTPGLTMARRRHAGALCPGGRIWYGPIRLSAVGSLPCIVKPCS